MKRSIKNILIAVAIVLVIWIIFITVDCIRLMNSKYYTYPLINLKQEVTKDAVTYTGLGYTIKYIQAKDINYTPGSDNVAVGVGAYGAEFRLFGKILVWAYIE